MRIFALSDIHIDYEVNAKWIWNLSGADYRQDLLILAGDVTHKTDQLAACLNALASKFQHLLFVPGNHDLWVIGEQGERTSLQKFAEVGSLAEDCGASMRPFRKDDVLIAPLFGWYDYSFGRPGATLREIWADFRTCRWPPAFEPADVAAHFDALNDSLTSHEAAKVITFSHFLPRLDLVPSYVSARNRLLDPVLGSTRLERQLRRLKASIHVYGHSHINRRVRLDGVQYINNAFGYPDESRIAARQLTCIDEI